MQNVEIRQLDLSSKYKANLIKAQYTTAAEVLLTPPNILRQRTTLSPADVNQLISQLSQAVLAREEASCRSIAELMEGKDSPHGGKISFGDAGLDQLFEGGVRVGSLTEIAGQSASGKTHLCLQLALNVQLPISQGGLSGGALFISSEGTLSTTRLLSLAAHMPLHPSSSLQTNGNSTPMNHDFDQTVWDYLDNVHPEKAPDVDTLEAVVSYHAPTAIERINSLAEANTVDPNLASLTTSSGENEPIASQFLSDNRTVPPRPPLPIRLVILDSIAAPLRAAHETGSSGFVNRAKELISIGDKLKRIAHVYNCAVVVINQVQDVFERTGPLPPHLLETNPPPPESSDTSPSRSTTPTASFISMPPPPPPPPLPPPSRPSSYFPSPSLSRTSSTSTSSSSYSQYSNGSLPPPHVQYSLPSLLYTRFQSPFSTGACIPPPSPYSPRVSAALGTTWTNLINTRVLCLISRRGGEPKRELNVVFGPEARRGKVEYELREEGARSVGEVELRGEAWMAEPDEEMREDEGEEEGEDSLWNQDWERAAIALEQGGEG
ncbi:hypothetical protein JCM5353_002646 [Sporobolomyces roseus]